jgi:hypothetical protein
MLKPAKTPLIMVLQIVCHFLTSATNVSDLDMGALYAVLTALTDYIFSKSVISRLYQNRTISVVFETPEYKVVELVDTRAAFT